MAPPPRKKSKNKFKPQSEDSAPARLAACPADNTAGQRAGGQAGPSGRSVPTTAPETVPKGQKTKLKRKQVLEEKSRLKKLKRQVRDALAVNEARVKEVDLLRGRLRLPLPAVTPRKRAGGAEGAVAAHNGRAPNLDDCCLCRAVTTVQQPAGRRVFL